MLFFSKHSSNAFDLSFIVVLDCKVESGGSFEDFCTVALRCWGQMGSESKAWFCVFKLTGFKL